MSSHSTATSHQRHRILFPLLIIYLLLNLYYLVEAEDEKSVTNIGAIIDVNSRIGKQQKAAMEIAAEKFNNQSETHEIVLHFCDSGRDPFLSAYAAEHLIKDEKVQVILGMETWQEAVTVADAVKNLSGDQVPVISFAAPAIQPPLIQRRWPFLIRMGSDVAAQMKCIGDVVSAYYWKRVVVIYEDDGYGGGIGRLAVLSQTLRNVGAKIEQRIVLPRLSDESDPYWDEIEEQLKLPNVQSRAFIVLQSSLPTVTGLFRVAKKVGLVGADSAWIITEIISSLLDPQGNHDMEGTLGIKTYYATNTTTYASFRNEFRTRYPDEDNSKPGIYALRAYDIISIITQAISSNTNTNTSLQDSVEKMLSNYNGLSGKMQLKGGQVMLDIPRFRIINIVDGKTDKELNLWTQEFGFSKDLVEVSGKHRSSDDVGNVTWPEHLKLKGRSSKGWAMPTLEKKMKIAIPIDNLAFTNVTGENTYDGFCIQLFNMVVGNLSYSLPHEFHEFRGNYSYLIELVHKKIYDAIVGDVTVFDDRVDKVEFTQPYMESGLAMIVPDISYEEETWMFMKPFTWQMWVVTGAILLYTTFIIWFLEAPFSPEFNGSFKSQIAFSTWFTFSSLFFSHREKVYRNLTRIPFIVWLFVVLILNSSYTAKLSSLLTIQRLSPNVTDIEMLRRTNSLVGCEAFAKSYLEDIFLFNPGAVVVIDRSYNPEEIRQKKLSAVFLELPYARVFMDKHKGFTLTSPTYSYGGFSFAFQKGSPIARDFSKVILDLLENEEVRKLEDYWLTPNKRQTNTTYDMPESLSLKSFWGLFVISVATSTFCFLIALTVWLKKLYNLLVCFSVWLK
ncbi:glutamate receptor 2.7-like [Argentina anserina]|uniref:glutamate receptor 2.7-like n=1 Tax=Argentina anserina TaxID=57926 RepID=UPI0021767845|nr:glutamate receptor 2.7-like [Potentilla anserina]